MADQTDSNPEQAPAPVVANQPAASAGGTWPGAFNVFGAVFDQVKKNPQPAYLFIGVYAGLALVSYFSNGSASSYGQGDASFESLAALIFPLALPVYSLALADKKVISIAEFMRFDVGRYLTVLAVTILTIIILVLSAIPLLIPLIWTIPWFAFGVYAAVDKKLGVIDSLKESKRLAQNHKGKVWGLIGVMILVMIAAGILSFIPVVGAALAAGANVLLGGSVATLYRWLQRNATASQ